MMTPDDIDVWVRLDVVEGAHHAHALDRDGDTLYDKPLKQDEKAIRSMLEHLSRRGRVLLVVDQPNTIGSLPLTVARDMGIAVAYLPSTAMLRTAQLPPETLRDAGLDDETLAALKLLAGHDEDLTHESTRHVNRLRSLLLQTHPAFERALKGERITREATLALLERYGGPAGMKRAGVEDVKDWAKSNGLRAGRIIDDMLKAIGEQTVTVPASSSACRYGLMPVPRYQSIIASCEGSVCMYVVFQMRKALVCACNNSQYSGGVRLQNSRCCDSLSANSGECTIPPMMR
ncbi:IS110 family transposase [Bifidobacterium breve]|uniref:IS110 family transposase n=1 Tax=Bifidobacterium breve TaxID=1685 RepID=UPI0022AEFBD7|nr:transposase [Bifidobacterium breve]MCZ4443567.1 transposase [Bifidobacterium breve]MCZ4445325.1 transposase [Bifidobacterium breve]MCZ4452329.1 transposase [Bifidobacterium breve]